MYCPICGKPARQEGSVVVCTVQPHHRTTLPERRTSHTTALEAIDNPDACKFARIAHNHKFCAGCGTKLVWGLR